jgi:hypothetical protein
MGLGRNKEKGCGLKGGFTQRTYGLAKKIRILRGRIR